jgi:amino acid transporter
LARLLDSSEVERVVEIDDPRRSLAKDSLRFFRTLAISVGIQGPTAGVIIGPAIIASIVGEPGALAQVVGLFTMGFVAYAFVVFSRSFNTASSIYAFNGTALGSGYGFVSAWILFLVYVSFAAGVYASTGDIAQTFLASFGVNIGWVPIAVVGAILSIVFAFLSIGLSNIVILICEGVSILLISLVGVVVLMHGGYRGHGVSASPFELHGVSVSVLALGVVGAFGQFSGFEGAASLGEESRQSTSTIPRAIAGSLILSALVYIFFTWIVYAAFPSAKAVASSPAPLVSVASTYLSPTVGKIVNGAGMISAFGAQLACLNAAARLLFSVGREVGGGQSARNLLVRTSRRFRSPIGALGIVAGLSFVGLFSFVFEPTANRAATLLIQYGAYLILAAYLMTVVGAVVWTVRTRGGLIPTSILVIGVLVVSYVSYKTFTPFPTYPFDYVLLGAGLSVVVGVAMLLVPSFKVAISSSKLLKVTKSLVFESGSGSPEGL